MDDSNQATASFLNQCNQDVDVRIERMVGKSHGFETQTLFLSSHIVCSIFKEMGGLHTTNTKQMQYSQIFIVPWLS